MTNLEEIRNEIVELENTVDMTMRDMKTCEIKCKDGVEKRRLLVKMQIDLGRDTRRLRTLRDIVSRREG